MSEYVKTYVLYVSLTWVLAAVKWRVSSSNKLTSYFLLLTSYFLLLTLLTSYLGVGGGKVARQLVDRELLGAHVVALGDREHLHQAEPRRAT